MNSNQIEIECTDEGNLQYKNIVMTARTVEMIRRIQEEEGIADISGTLTYCVSLIYKKDYYKYEGKLKHRHDR